MVKGSRAALDDGFSALADPTRRAILQRLRSGPLTVGALAEPFNMSLPAVSKHIRVLEDAGLVRRERDGRAHRIHLEARPMLDLVGWIVQYRSFWDGQLDSLEAYLEEGTP